MKKILFLALALAIAIPPTQWAKKRVVSATPHSDTEKRGKSMARA